MASTVKQARATRASLTALGVAAGIVPGQVYLLTDEGRLAVGLTPTAFQTFAKESEAGGGAPWMVKTADYTASDGDRILADTSGGPWTLTLPVGGTMVEVLDLIGTWPVNGLAVATTGGETLRGAPGGLICDQTANLQFQGLGTGVWLVKKIGLAAGAPPFVDVLPVITGDASVGATLTGADGTWKNAPSSFARQWYADGVAITGATGSTYVPVSADVGKAITFGVSATNGDGTILAFSEPTLPVFGRSEAEFNAHIETLAANGALGWTAGVDIGGSAPYGRKYRTTAADFSGPLHGSPAGGRVATSGAYNTVARIVQHSLPDGDVSGAVAGRQIYFEIERNTADNAALISKTVNGFTSTAVPENVVGSGPVKLIIWWSRGRAWSRNPFSNSPATPYNW